MNKVRSRFVVEHDLDMMPGFNFSPEHMADYVLSDLWSTIPHYRPLVKCADIDTIINRNPVDLLSSDELLIELRKATISPIGSKIFANRFDCDNPFAMGSTTEAHKAWLTENRELVISFISRWHSEIDKKIGIPLFAYKPTPEGRLFDIEEATEIWENLPTNENGRSVFRSKKMKNVVLTLHHNVVDNNKVSMVFILAADDTPIKVRGACDIDYQNRHGLAEEKINSEVLELLKEL